MKAIYIDTCGDCPHLTTGRYIKSEGLKYSCGLLHQPIMPLLRPPGICPLENKEEIK